MAYRIFTEYLEHDGGTKFYEVTRIVEERGGAVYPDSPAILIKRWSSITDKMGGGQTKIERGNNVQMADEWQRILNDKERLKPGKGQYVRRARIKLGLHKWHGGVLQADTLVQAAHEHYNLRDMKAIASYFGIDASDDGTIDLTEPPEAETEEDISARGEAWASW